MSTFVVECSGCHTRYRLPATKRGTKLRCKNCRTTIVADDKAPANAADADTRTFEAPLNPPPAILRAGERVVPEIRRVAVAVAIAVAANADADADAAPERSAPPEERFVPNIERVAGFGESHARVLPAVDLGLPPTVDLPPPEPEPTPPPPPAAPLIDCEKLAAAQSLWDELEAEAEAPAPEPSSAPVPGPSPAARDAAAATGNDADGADILIDEPSVFDPFFGSDPADPTVPYLRPVGTAPVGPSPALWSASSPAVPVPSDGRPRPSAGVEVAPARIQVADQADDALMFAAFTGSPTETSMPPAVRLDEVLPPPPVKPEPGPEPEAEPEPEPETEPEPEPLPEAEMKSEVIMEAWPEPATTPETSPSADDLPVEEISAAIEDTVEDAPEDDIEDTGENAVVGAAISGAGGKAEGASPTATGGGDRSRLASAPLPASLVAKAKAAKNRDDAKVRDLKAYCTGCAYRFLLPRSYAGRTRLKCPRCGERVYVLGVGDPWPDFFAALDAEKDQDPSVE